MSTETTPYRLPCSSHARSARTMDGSGLPYATRKFCAVGASVELSGPCVGSEDAEVVALTRQDHRQNGDPQQPSPHADAFVHAHQGGGLAVDEVRRLCAGEKTEDERRHNSRDRVLAEAPLGPGSAARDLSESEES